MVVVLPQHPFVNSHIGKMMATVIMIITLPLVAMTEETVVDRMSITPTAIQLPTTAMDVNALVRPSLRVL